MSERKATAQPGGMTRISGDAGRPNTIGLQARDLDALLDQLDAASDEADNRRRDFVRWPLRRASVRIHVIHQDNTAARIQVACRNISCGGMSVLHNSFIHPNSPCVVGLQKTDGSLVALKGAVVRCNHVRGVIHELGVKFNDAIVVRDFIETDPFEDCFSLEKVDPEKLKGCIVHVEDSEMDQSLVRHFLRCTNLRVRPADDAKKGLELAQEGCDLILADVHMPGTSGLELIVELKSAGIDVPIIMITSDTSDGTRQTLLELGADAFLTKPITQDLLLRAIAEFLTAGTASGPISSTLSTDHEQAVLVPGFVKQLQDYATQLSASVETDDAMTCRSLCLQIRGTAPSLGYEKIARLADEVIKSVTSSMSVVESIHAVRELTTACQRCQPTLQAAPEPEPKEPEQPEEPEKPERPEQPEQPEEKAADEAA